MILLEQLSLDKPKLFDSYREQLIQAIERAFESRPPQNDFTTLQGEWDHTATLLHPDWIVLLNEVRLVLDKPGSLTDATIIALNIRLFKFIDVLFPGGKPGKASSGMKNFYASDVLADSSVGKEIRLTFAHVIIPLEKLLEWAKTIQRNRKKCLVAQFFDDAVKRGLGVCYENFQDDYARIAIRYFFLLLDFLSRDKKNQLSNQLPWGDSSLRFLNYLGAIFPSEYTIRGPNKYIIICSPQMTLRKQLNAQQFRHALDNINCLIRIALPDILEELKAILGALEKFVMRPSIGITTPIKLKKITYLLSYSREMFSYARLMALLPLCFDIKKIYGYADRCSFPKTVYNQLMLLELKTDFSPSSIEAFALLRSVQMVGELFLETNLGEEWFNIDYIDPYVLRNIRNYLSHIEDHGKLDALVQLETDTSLIIKLYKELQILRDKVVTAVIKRQNQLSRVRSLGTIDQIEDWGADMLAYWESIQRKYQFTTDEWDNFIPHYPLLKEEEIDLLVSKTTPNRRDPLRTLLTGEACITNMVDDFSPSERSSVSGLLKKANAKYYQFKKDAKLKADNDLKARRAKLKTDRNNAMLKFPTLVTIDEACKQDKIGTASPNHQIIYERLQDRLILLKKILSEPLSKPNPHEAIDGAFHQNVETYLSVSYLLTQIVSLLNKLETMIDLSQIHPNLSRDLQEYVAIRNSLAHGGSFLESELQVFIQMESLLTPYMITLLNTILSDSIYTAVTAKQPTDLTLKDTPSKLCREDELDTKTLKCRDTTSFLAPPRIPMISPARESYVSLGVA